jgi:uncharacterized protein (TIGR04222 family)
VKANPGREGVARPAAHRRVPALLLVALTVALSVALLMAAAAPAQAKSWRINNMDVLLDVQQGSDVLVQETVTFTFQGSFSFVTRAIPTRNVDAIKDIQVMKDGVPLPKGTDPGTYTVFDDSGYRVIKLNVALADTSATWTFVYRVQGVIQYWDQGDELRWYVFDDITPVPIDAVTATVKLPGSVAVDKMTGAIDTVASVQPGWTAPAPSTLVFTAKSVPAYTKYWIVAGFPKGTVAFPWTLRRIGAFIVPKAGLALPIFVFLGMLLLWRKRGRDDPQAVFARYVSEPPSDLPPGLAGALIDETVDVKEVTATIVDLAGKGYIDITDDKQGSFPLAKSVTTFRRLKPTDDLPGYQKKVADALFGGHGDEVSTKELKNHFYKNVLPICDAIYEEVTQRGYFTKNPKSVRARWVGLGVFAAILLGVLTVIFAIGDVGGWGYFAFGSIITVVILVVFARYMPARTAAGALEQKKWLAFRNYLRDLTRFQDLATAKDTFERYLPYAIAFAVERDWARRFHELEVPPPVWYHPIFLPGWGGGWTQTTSGAPGTQMTGLPVGMPGGGGAGLPGGGFSLDTISDSLFGSLNNMSSAMTSVPSSTGSGRGAFGGGGGGGGFGGGFSGGGGGGGFGAG